MSTAAEGQSAGPSSDEAPRTIGLLAATGIGVGAIVGGGVFVLAGVAYTAAGPAAMVAFGLNGLVAFLTAMSFAEISSAFPESGGAYAFAKKVLSVRAAFAVGWVLCFAYIVAGVLYALGFAEFAVLAIRSVILAAGGDPPAWLEGRRMLLLLATGAASMYALSLIRKAAGGGQWATVGKVILFVVLIIAGLLALLGQPLDDTREAVTPFFVGGVPGLLAAMGFTFIALQGFDLVAAVAGEVKTPSRTIPRAMFYSLGAALLIYLPLLFVVAAVGAPELGITELARRDPATVIAAAVRRFMGPVGYWMVIVAALLSTLSALHANILAASRVALSMARDRTLPGVLSDLHQLRGTPVMAIYASALTLVAILFMVPNLAAAGAAASLIFLISFALAHITTYLARIRGGATGDAYRTPWFPAVPAAGFVMCAALAVFQAVVVPDAAGIVVIWLGLGVILYLGLFSRAAETADASAEALDPNLVRLRGQNPLVLLPIANPRHAAAMVAVANALVPSTIGRVLVLAIVPSTRAEAAHGDDGDRDPRARLGIAQDVVREALTPSYAGGHTPEALITTASDPLAEIARVADTHACEALLIGAGKLSPEVGAEAQLERLLNTVDCDVAVMRAPDGWSLATATRILVPVGGRGEQHELRARLLGSLCRGQQREVTFLRVLPADASDRDVAEATRAVERSARTRLPGASRVVVRRSSDVAACVLGEAAEHDLIVLGLRRQAPRRVGVGELSVPLSWQTPRAVFGDVNLRIAAGAPCATILLSSKL